MNVFYLDEDTKLCAQAHCDKHVVKMILEYAQVMSTAHRVLDEPSDLIECMYRQTHKNHPAAVWVRESEGNYKWLYEMWHYLCKEYWWRYDKVHKSWNTLYNKLSHVPINIPKGKFTRPPQCMPEYLQRKDTIEAYRDYYIQKKSTFAKWGGAANNNRLPPEWYVRGLELKNANV
jgi:hypothetical protein